LPGYASASNVRRGGWTALAAVAQRASCVKRAIHESWCALSVAPQLALPVHSRTGVRHRGSRRASRTPRSSSPERCRTRPIWPISRESQRPGKRTTARCSIDLPSRLVRLVRTDGDADFAKCVPKFAAVEGSRAHALSCGLACGKSCGINARTDTRRGFQNARRKAISERFALRGAAFVILTWPFFATSRNCEKKLRAPDAL
jgi:hypothetical protein